MGMIGQYLVPLFPKRVAALKDGQFTLSDYGQSRQLIDHFLRYGMLYKMFKENDLDELALYHENFWKGEAGTMYHEQYASEFDNIFLPTFAYITDFIELSAQGHAGYRAFGCGFSRIGQD